MFSRVLSIVENKGKLSPAKLGHGLRLAKKISSDTKNLSISQSKCIKCTYTFLVK